MNLWRLKKRARIAVQQVGIDITRCRPGGFPYDFEDHHIELIKRVKDFTMTSNERLSSLISAVEYVVRSDVKGALVECGVYKGGSIMAVALTLLRANCKDRDLFLYDTFSGMTRPADVDVDMHGRAPDWQTWPFATLDEVRAAVLSTRYPAERVHFVEGRVEETLPAHAPSQLALLRLDTDWYESTKHELLHLFPKLAPGGVLIIDDYGQYKGARRAVDEYIAENNVPILLNRIDFTGRIGVKL